jgi:exopolysaccharide production protein ExoZ
VDRQPRDKLQFIQALRGIAALAVVCYHARIFIDGPAFLQFGSRVFGTAHTGVDLFFVVSGFIMVHTTHGLAATPRAGLDFFLKRLVRVWPVYAIAFAAMWFITRGLPSPAFNIDATHVVTALTFQPLQPHGQAPFFGYPLLHVGWTLVYEFWFYTLFAVSLLFGNFRWLALSALFVGLLVVVPIVAGHSLSFDATASYGLPRMLSIAANPMMWEFAIGVAIGLVYQTGFCIKDRGVALSMVALTVGIVLWQLWSGFRSGHGPLHAGTPMAALVFSLAMLHKNHPIAPPAWMVWLGDVSFSLYLWHVLPQMIPRQWRHPALMTGGGFFVVCIATAIILAYWSHRLIERGIAQQLRSWLEKRIVFAR